MDSMPLFRRNMVNSCFLVRSRSISSHLPVTLADLAHGLDHLAHALGQEAIAGKERIGAIHYPGASKPGLADRVVCRVWCNYFGMLYFCNTILVHEP